MCLNLENEAIDTLYLLRGNVGAAAANMRAIKFSALVFGIFVLAALTAQAKQETWVEVRSPNFVVLSNAGEKQARKTAVQFEQIRALFRQTFQFANNAPSPVITIFAVKDESSLHELLPEYWAKGHAHPAGIFFSRLNQFYVAIQLDAPGDNPYMGIYHEYYHSISLPFFPGMPVWLAEGLADFFGNSRIDGDKAYMGDPDPGLIQLLRQERLIPLDVLFSVDHSSPYYNEQNKISVFYAESWALTHYLFIGDGGAHRQLLNNYLTLLGQGATQQDAAAKAFGDFGKLQLTLQSYIQNDRYYDLHAPAPPKLADADLTARTLSEAEVDAERGGFEAARGRLEDAKPLLDDAVRLDPKLALARQNLGILELFEGQKDEAIDSLSQAIALDPKNGTAHYLRAYATASSGGLIADDQQLEGDLRQAIAQDPTFAAPYAMLAVYLAANSDASPEALSLAKKAVELQPGTAEYQVNLAQVLMRMRRYNDAQLLLQRSRIEAASPVERGRIDQMLTVLQQFRNNPESMGPAPSENQPPLPTLQHRPESAPAAGSASSDSTPQSASREISGVVISVSCGQGIQVQVQAASGATYRLHVAPGAQFHFEMDAQPPTGFNPCSSIKGLHVTAHYTPDDADGETGTLELLEIEIRGLPAR